MLNLARRGRPSLITTRGSAVSTASLTDGNAEGSGDSSGDGCAARESCDAGCFDRLVRDSLQDTVNAATTRTAAAARALPVIPPPYDRYRDSHSPSTLEVRDAGTDPDPAGAQRGPAHRMQRRRVGCRVGRRARCADVRRG